MNPTLLSAVGALVLASTAAAQGSPISFGIDAAASQFSFSGTTSFGPIVGNPSSLGLSGTVDARLSAGLLGSPVGTIEFVPTGSAVVAPDINAFVPNPIPFLPALATISITGYTFNLSSDPIPVGPTGAFSGMVVAVAATGTLTITPLGSSPAVSDLTGATSDPQLISGTSSTVGSTTALASSLDLSFALNDPVSGVSGTVNLVGSVEADYTVPSVVTYCSVEPNSSGAPAVMGTSGTSSLSSGNLELTGSSLPQNSFGFFLFSEAQGFNAGFGGSFGNLCLGAPIFRLSNFVQSSGGAGQVSLPVPYGGLPGGVVFEIGDSWNFQYWFRDQIGGVVSSNTSGGLNITFAP